MDLDDYIKEWCVKPSTLFANGGLRQAFARSGFPNRAEGKTSGNGIAKKTSMKSLNVV